MDQRVKDLDIQIIGIFRRDSIQPFHCHFCCRDYLNNFGFPFVTTDVICQIPQNCDATHVSLETAPDKESASDYTWLPIRNQKTDEREQVKIQFDLTVCISNLFGNYNNVLQFAQTLEMYRLLGVNRVVIYNTSCGPELDHLLQSYSQEGFVEMVAWPIDKHLNPSRGWYFSRQGGDLHYFGQLTTHNECNYRSMEHSRYVLLNDIDEIVMPYQHNSLMSLISAHICQYRSVAKVICEKRKTKEMIIDPRKRRDQHTSLFMNGTQVERVKTFKFLCTYISEDLTWTYNTVPIVKKAQQRHFFLRKLRKFGLSPKLLSNFYRCILTREHPDKLHHSVVWELHYSGQEDSTACQQSGTIHLWSCLPITTGHL
uniref:Glycosyltransferase family 92 protein n=1 Tax=Amphilophus citrinellus TaxID=61819 RepID=A0A3Q0SIH7_AMPCI